MRIMRRYLALTLIVLSLAGCERDQDRTNPMSLTFPVQDPVNDYMEALMEGELVERHGCLYVDGGRGRGVSPIWPHGFSYERDGDTITILDEEGAPVMSTGDEVSMGGGLFAKGGHSPLPDKLVERVGDCAGPYWIVGEVN